MIIHKFNKTFEGTVIRRPSKINKSPYLADVKINDKEYMAHSPSLSLSGLIKNGSKVIMEKNENEKNVSQYKIVTVKVKEFETKNKQIYVGANPVLVNKLFLNCINLNLIKFPKIKDIKTEIPFYGSRIDFEIIDNNNIKHIIECKYAPTVDYHPDHKPVKNVSVGSKDNYKRAAIFPDGWQYKKGAVVSERAVKHLHSLIKGVNNGYKCYNFYFCLREDIEYFRPNYEKDKIFTELIKKAFDKGVVIKAFKLKYSKNNIKFLQEIPINLY
tara:strand:+ start:558 stop:1370 length:813 start_codon:yes stop_codon:yes gene_type:complete